MAKPDSNQANRGQAHGRRRQPITRHPLFPAVVALWFGALLAVGSVALSTSLIENLVLAARIDSIIPAAAPPLGATARLMLALAFGLLGGLAGWALARRAAAPKNVVAPQVFNVAEANLGAPPQWPGMAETPARREPPARFEPPAADPAPTLDPASLVREAVFLVAAPPPIAESAPEQEVIPAPPTPAAAQRIVAAELAGLSHVELVERLAIAMQRRDKLRAAATAGSAGAAAPVLQFPDFPDRRGARVSPPAAQSRPAPQETERALRQALAQLQRMSG